MPYHRDTTHDPPEHRLNTSCMKTQEHQTSSYLPLIPGCNCLHSYLLTSLLLVFSSFLPASCFKTKTESCSRCFALAHYNVTCQLNTFQEEPQKLKIFLWTMNVSEDYCNRIITCDRWIIWKWFWAHMKRMASLHRAHLFSFLLKFFWNCKCLRCLPDFFCLFSCSPPSSSASLLLSLSSLFPPLACRGCF